MQVMPSSEIRNNYAEVSNLAKSINEPIFLTKNGYADGVYMSMETFKQYLDHSEFRKQILESEALSSANGKFYSHDDVFDMMENTVREYFDGKDNL